MSDTIEIKLAGQVHNVHGFTVGQLADLHIASNEPQPDLATKEGARAFWARNSAILAIALQKTLDEIANMKLGSFKEINAAIMDIMIFSGIWTRKEDSSPGEAQGAA